MVAALRTLPVTQHPDLLVGYNKADDAGVFRLSENQALVQTVDFFPPIVDDPYHFGRIAAANALSDVYAMGGRPLTALNILCYPIEMGPEILADILRGGMEKVEEAGAVVVGGHSVKDKELKFGISVTGIVDPRRVVTNGGAQNGDCLILTKPLGTGLITTGIKAGVVDEDLTRIVIESMARLNREAAELMLAHGVHAATDITGYGLLGHAFEMADASGVTLVFDSSTLPLLPHVLELAAKKMIPGGANANRDCLEGRVRIADSVEADLEAVLFDPQTSGGLLIALPPDQVDTYLADAAKKDIPAVRIGHAVARTDIELVVE